jgi:hypothetical protein
MFSTLHLQNFVFFKTLFCGFLFCFYNIFIEIKNSIWLPKSKWWSPCHLLTKKSYFKIISISCVGTLVNKTSARFRGRQFVLFAAATIWFASILATIFCQLQNCCGSCLICCYVRLVHLYRPMSNLQPKSIGSPTTGNGIVEVFQIAVWNCARNMCWVKADFVGGSVQLLSLFIYVKIPSSFF